jgi:hypothetical protein
LLLVHKGENPFQIDHENRTRALHFHVSKSRTDI